MRKIKKVNGYLVVKFNDRELREWTGTALGTYGVIDAELYTGTLEIDRSVMEYDDADSLEVAIELARGLESELDVEEPDVTVTVVKETDETTEEEEFDAQLLINGWESQLKSQVKSLHHPEVNSTTAAHALYGFKVALNRLGMLDAEACFVRPDTFGDCDIPKPLPREPDRYPDTNHRTAAYEPYGFTRALESLYALGLALEEDCPQNDCHLYLNIFHMAQELDTALDTATGYTANTLKRELLNLHRELREMYRHNYAIQRYKEAMQP